MAQLGGTFFFFGDIPIWGYFHIGDPQRVNVSASLTVQAVDCSQDAYEICGTRIVIVS